jgi:hypothetical protein
MKRILAAAVLLASFQGLARAQQAAAPAASYQIDLAPTGRMLSSDKPVLRGSTYVFHSYPSGTLMSLRRSQVRQVQQVAIDTSDPSYKAVQIGNLAMQGGSTQAGPKNASQVQAKKDTSGLGTGFYNDIIPGETQAYGNSANDYQVGRTYAYAPSTATQSSPGAPPTNSGATSGQNPPTMSGSNPQ